MAPETIRSSRSFRLLLVPAALLLLTSCMVGPNYQIPRAEVERQWVERQAVSGKSYGTPEIFWWKNFKDPVLTRLVNLAYENNLSLQVAGVRILQARAELNRSIGNLFPQQQQVSGGLNYSYIPPATSGSTGGTTDPTLNAITQDLSSQSPSISIGPNLFTNQYLFSATWEIDFWGKYRVRSSRTKRPTSRRSPSMTTRSSLSSAMWPPPT